MLNRARAKYFTLGLIYGLVDLDSPLNKSYWNTYHCASILTQTGDKITSKYCKNRWCMVCNRIRTAINILKYSDIINSWGDDKYFVTLTFPNVEEGILQGTIVDMIENFKKIGFRFKYLKVEFVGIRKLECTYNPKTNTYHPHFHCIIKGKKSADLLLSEWLKLYPNAESYCQDIRQCDNNTVMELFKYFTKLITSGYDKDSDNSPKEYKRKIYINALDKIFIAMRGLRTFQSFGFKAKIVDESKVTTVQVDEICDKIQYYSWDIELSDWINRDSGECLTGYKPSEAMKRLIDDMNTTL